MSRLDQEEQGILDAFESGNTKQSKNAKQTQDQHQSYAEAMVQDGSRINIQLSSKDLRSLQRKALVEGIPYQTFVASILHKFVEGHLS